MDEISQVENPIEIVLKNTLISYVEILVNVSKSFEILLNITEQYWTGIIITSYNFNKLKYIINK